MTIQDRTTQDNRSTLQRIEQKKMCDVWWIKGYFYILGNLCREQKVVHQKQFSNQTQSS
jgi:hypothetical protein